MSYLMMKMLLCLLAAALLGFLIGWFLRAFFCRKEQEEQEASWRTRLEDCHSQLKTIGDEKDEWRLKFDRSEADAKDLETSWQAKLTAAEESSAQAAADLETSWQTKLTAAEESSAQAAAALGTSWQAKLTAAEEGAAKAKTDLDASWQSKLEDCQARLASSGNELSDLRAKLTAAEEGAAKAKSDLDASWQAKLEDCQAQLSSTGEELADLRAKLESTGADSAQAAADLEAAWRAKLEACQAQLAAAAEEVAAAKAEAEEAKASSALAAGAAGAAGIVGLMGSFPAGGPDNKDDLKKVEGIGPKIEGLLNADGIWTWAQLAASPVDRLKGVLQAAGERYRIHDPTTWPDQSRLAAEGRWEELEKLQDILQGGRQG